MIHIYCQIYVFSQFVINSDTMQGKMQNIKNQNYIVSDYGTV